MEISIKEGGFKPFVLEIKVDTREEAIALAFAINIGVSADYIENISLPVTEGWDEMQTIVAKHSNVLGNIHNKIMNQL